MNFLRFDRSITRKERQDRRRERRKRLMGLLGIFAGGMLNTRWIGWIIGFAVILFLLIFLGEML